MCDMYVHIYIQIHIHIYMYIMGGAPRNPAPGHHFLAWTVKPSGCRCRDGHFTSRVFTEDQKVVQSAEPR